MATARLDPSAPQTPLDVLAAVAADQGGPFTRRQALAAGVSPRRIRTLLTREWTELRRGIYVTYALLDAGTAQQQHVVHCAARVLASSGEPVVSHRSAALVHRLPVLGPLPRHPQLTRAAQRPRDTAPRTGLHVASLPPGSTTVVAGVPVTSVARTVCDVARQTDVRHGLVTADAALRAGLDSDALRAEAACCSGWPGSRRAAEVAAAADGRAETPLESITRWACAEQGLPAPETQVEVWAPDGSLVGLVDFLWRAERTIGEADGLAKYDRDGALRAEKLREQQLRSCGYDVVRSTWDDVWLPGGRRAHAERVRQAFAWTAGRPVVPGVRLRVPDLAELRRITAAYERGRQLRSRSGPGGTRAA